MKFLIIVIVAFVLAGAVAALPVVTEKYSTIGVKNGSGQEIPEAGDQYRCGYDNEEAESGSNDDLPLIGII